MRNFLGYVSVFLVVLLGSISITSIAFQNQALNPELYTDALYQSGVYTQATNVVEEYTTNSVVDLSKSFLEEQKKKRKEEDQKISTIGLEAVLEYLIQNKSDEFVRAVYKSIDLEGNMQKQTEEEITATVEWLKGNREDPAIYAYIPSVEQMESLEDEGILKSVTVIGFLRAFGVSELSECSNEEEIQENLERLQGGKLREVTCTSESLKPIIWEEVLKIVPEELIDKAQANVDDFLEEYNLKPVVDQIFTFIKEMSKFKEYTYTVRDYISYNRYAATTLFFIAVVLSFLVLLLAKGNKFVTFFGMYFAIGFVVVLASLSYRFIISGVVLNSMNFDGLQIESEEVSSATGELFFQSVEKASEKIVYNLANDAIAAGITIILITGIILLIYSAIRNRRELKKGVANGYEKVKKEVKKLDKKPGKNSKEK